MSLGAPQFLLLIPLLILVGWSIRSLQLWKPLRACLLLLLVLALCDPRLRLKSGGIDLWVLLDRSLSAQELVDPQVREWKSLLERSKPSSKDELHFIDYADEVVPIASTETAVYPGNRDLTRTALAIRDTLARADESRHNRILLFSDGYSTEPLGSVAEKLLERGVPLDYRALRPPEAIDYRVSLLEIPDRVQLGEPFVVDVVVSGNLDATISMTMTRAGEKLFTRDVMVRDGVGRFQFSDRIANPGSQIYAATIAPENDAHSGNNLRERWIEVVSGPRLLLLSNYEDDPVAKILRAQGFDVVVIDDFGELSAGTLTGAKAVVFNNVPAYELPNDFLKSLDFFVTEQGGGLLMAGGERSFGSGGYFESPVDALLPVSMELKSEHRKLAVAMAIVMDRSGSMAMTTPSGHSKMQLANEGAARAVELLSEMDAMTVYAVDSTAHQICQLLNVGKSRGELLERVRRIESMGGGIFVYTGMAEAWKELQKSELGQRHMILFSDAADSEEPGQYKELIQTMTDDGATISVIGLGTKSDPDAAFLEDIAKRGGGRAFFTDVAGDLPNIFAQETVTVARASFIDEPVGTQPTGRWYELARTDLAWMSEVDGYNLSYVREGDEAALITSDTYTAPLVAYGRRGIGRTAALSFPLGGDFSEKARSWDEFGNFLQTMTRWLMGDEIPPGIGIKPTLTGTELTLDLYYDIETWSETFATNPPTLRIKQGYREGEAIPLTWERIAPGEYSVKTDLAAGEPIRGAIQIDGAAIPFGPIAVGGSSEWQFDPVRVDELRETARTSGGEELLDLTDAWRKPPSPEFEPVRDWFLALALVLFLLEAFVTRTGWKMPTKQGAPQRSVAEARPAISPEPPPPETDPEEAPSSAPNRSTRKSRFDRAKRRS